MGKLVLAAAAVVASLSLTAGVAAAQSGSISGTGHESNNVVSSSDKTDTKVHNNNTGGVTNTTGQNASSGSANVSHNKSGGSAATGSVGNTADVETTATIKNSSVVGGSGGSPQADASGTIENTGGKSNNVVRSDTSVKTTITNDNDLHVTNNTTQSAHSGAATVSGNKTGGDATTGDVSNNSTTKTTITFMN